MECEREKGGGKKREEKRKMYRRDRNGGKEDSGGRCDGYAMTGDSTELHLKGQLIVLMGKWHEVEGMT